MNIRMLGIVAALACACTPDHATVGGFQVSWDVKSPTLKVRSSDGRDLLATQGSLLDSRTTTASWEMIEGSFRVSEGSEGWNTTSALVVKSADDKRVLLDITQTGGHHGTLEITSPAKGVLQIKLGTDSQNRVRANFACAASDHFLGFGSQADSIDHRGHLVPIWTSEPGIGKSLTEDDSNKIEDWFLTGARHAASYPLPTFISNRGMAFLADTTRRSVFDLCKADPNVWSVEAWDSSVTLKVFDGPSPAEALEKLTADIGRQPMANDLALAPWNDAIFGSDNVRQIAANLRAAHVPSGAIWTEDFRGGTLSGDSYRLKEEWDVDRDLYPDIEAVASDLHDLGFRWFAYHNTFLTADTQILEDARQAGVLIHHEDGSEYTYQNAAFKDSSMVDLNNPDGVAFTKHWLQKLGSYGFDGWMADYAEWLPADAKLFDGSNAEAVHNDYPLAYHRISADVVSAMPGDPNTHLYFARSGTLRTAPFQQVVWGGDQSTDFDPGDGLPSAVTLGLNFGLGGISTYGSDIAGYQNAVGPPSTKEIFFRWTTFGALSPVMRTHHGTKATLNWRWDSDEETKAHFARWATFHARLWPYLKASAQTAYTSGLPIMRALPLAYPKDASVWTISDEYMFGPDLLVAPVIKQGATSRDVYFPEGTWLPFDAGTSRTGPATISEDMPLSEIGLYAKAGSIIPLLPEGFDSLMPAKAPLVTLADVRNKRTLRVFAGANGSWTDLDGDRYDLQSSSTAAVTGVRVDGTVVPSCDSNEPPCTVLDATSRSATVRGSSLNSVSFDQGGASSTVTATGSLTVGEIVLRY